MSEALLKALMKLFALASDVDDITVESRDVVRYYLETELNKELAKKYVKMYEEYIKRYHGISIDDDVQGQAIEEVSDELVLKVCGAINQDLQQKQKIVILLRLIEYILADENLSEHELNFLNIVSESFKIPQWEYDICLKFLEGDKALEIPDHPEILLINSKEDAGNRKLNKHLGNKTLSGSISILRFANVGMYALRYFGKDELYLNGQIITPLKAYILTVGSSIRSSKVTPIYFSDIINTFTQVSEKEKIVFRAEEIEYHFKGGNIGLHKMNLAEEDGTLIGIMGGSGTGKSTLLNVLNGNYIPTYGRITINGFDIHDPKNNIERIIGYVPQDDLLIEELTVFQNLFYNTKLCYAQLKDAEIEDMVLNLLRDLGLLETKDLKVGSPMDKTISGGQRKRLNIALELIREPPVLFVDEPTSGLSSRDSENIMDLLKELSLKGKVIFVVIHQPSSDIFKMFDKLYILDIGGRLIYNGNPVDGISYFKRQANYANVEEVVEHVNPELIFNIIEAKVVDEYGNFTHERKVSPDEWREKYDELLAPNQKIIPDSTESPKTGFQIPNIFKQFKVFITRDVLSKLTNRQYMMINLLESPVLALILAYFIRFHEVHQGDQYVFLENENIPAYIFMAVVVALFVGLTVSAEEIIRDQKIRKREKFLNLSNGSYLFSKILIMFCLSAIQTYTFVLIGNNILGIDGLTFDYWYALFTVACFANALGLNISASFNSAVTIYILIPFLIIPQLIFSGVIVKFDKLNPTISSKTVVPIIGEMMASRWAFEALAVQQYIYNNFERHIYAYDKELLTADYRKTYWIPKLKAKIGFLQNSIEKGENNELVEDGLLLLRNELTKQNAITNKIQFDRVDDLRMGSVDTDLLDEVDYHLDRLKNFYIKVYNYTTDQKDVAVGKANKAFKEQGGFHQLKEDYRNEGLRDLVTNKLEIDAVIELDGELIQQNNPVYRDSPNLRAHFFAPTKTFFGKRYDTYWVNMFVIWFMTWILIIALYNDWLRKLLKSLSSGPVFKKKK